MPRSRSGWQRRFTDPIRLPDGGELATLEQAARHIQGLPAAQHTLPHWQTAVEHLIYAAERGPAWMLLAQMAVLKAMHHDEPSPPPTRRRRPPRPARIIR